MTSSPQTGGVTGTLTDGTGVSKLLASKFIKDFVLDVCLGLPAALAAVNIGGVESALAASTTTSFVLLDTVGRALFRIVVRWAQSDRVV